MQTFIKLAILLLFISIRLKGQDSDINRLIQGELRMMFPSIHFKHNSVDYSPMPYSVDSCLKFIANHFKDNMNSLVIWRDSMEAEELTDKRIKKLNADLRKYVRNEKILIYKVGNEQKVSRQIINKTSDSVQIKYLLSLNSVFDISKTRFRLETKKKNWRSHQMLPRPWCLGCWKNGFHIAYRRNMRKVKKNSRK